MSQAFLQLSSQKGFLILSRTKFFFNRTNRKQFIRLILLKLVKYVGRARALNAATFLLILSNTTFSKSIQACAVIDRDRESERKLIGNFDDLPMTKTSERIDILYLLSERLLTELLNRYH